MGMFDTVRCLVRLPDGLDPKQGWLQTKDFDCTMSDYTIREDGTLWAEEWHHELVPKHERPYPNVSDDDIRGICGCMKKIITREYDMKFHGVLNFYTICGPEKSWHGYNAKFTDGKLVSIDCEDEASDGGG